MQKKEPDKTPEIPVYWIETSDSVSRHFQFEPDGQLSVSLFLFSFLEFSNPDPLSLLSILRTLGVRDCFTCEK